MTEQNKGSEEHEHIGKAFYQQAASLDGVRIRLNGQDELTLRIGRGEITLFLKPEPSSEGTESLDPEAAEPSAESAAASAISEREARRVRLAGRVASEPQYAPLPRKGLRVSFVVAEHHDDGLATFHRTYATGEYARRIQQKNPLKGDEVTLDGERQTNRIRQADGSFKESELIYCYGLRVKVQPRRNG